MPKKSYHRLNVTLIHNLKKKIEELRESEEKFKNIFSRSADSIIIADIETKKLIEVNDQACRYTGYSKEELLKKGVLDIHPKKDLQYILDEFKLQGQGKKTLAENIPILRKDKKVVYADINSVPILIQGKSCLMGIFRDVTKHRRIEEELKSKIQELGKLKKKIKRQKPRKKKDQK